MDECSRIEQGTRLPTKRDLVGQKMVDEEWKGVKREGRPVMQRMCVLLLKCVAGCIEVRTKGGHN